jgi:superfamily II DNA/RNA helicase
MREPQFLMLSADSPSLIGVKQYHHLVKLEGAQSAYHLFEAKLAILLGILAEVPFHQCVVFFNNRGKASELVEALNDASWEAVCIDGDMAQAERQAAMSLLRDFKVRVLVSTDLTSRGVDVSRISLVINFDLPQHPATYLHRVGRTGRFGTLGVAISLVAKGEEFTRLVLFGKLFDCSIASMPDNPHDIPIDYLNGRVLTETEQKAAEALEAKKAFLKARAAQALLNERESDGGGDVDADEARDGGGARGGVDDAYAVSSEEPPTKTFVKRAEERPAKAASTVVAAQITPEQRQLGSSRRAVASTVRHQEPNGIPAKVADKPLVDAKEKVNLRPSATNMPYAKTATTSSPSPTPPITAVNPFTHTSVHHHNSSRPSLVPQVAASSGLYMSPFVSLPINASSTTAGPMAWPSASPAPVSYPPYPSARAPSLHNTSYTSSFHNASIPPCHCRDCLWQSALSAATTWRRNYSPIYDHS